MAPRNSMRTKTWPFKKTTFPLNFCQNGRGAKAGSQNPGTYGPRNMTKQSLESKKNIVYSMFDVSKRICYFI